LKVRRKILDVWLVLLTLFALMLLLPLQAWAVPGFNVWYNSGSLNVSNPNWNDWTWSYLQPPTTSDSQGLPCFNSKYPRVYVFGDFEDLDLDSTDEATAPVTINGKTYNGCTFKIAYYDSSGALVQENDNVRSDDIDPYNYADGNSDPEFAEWWLIGGNYTDKNPNEMYYTYPQVYYNLNTHKTAKSGIWHAVVMEEDDTIPSTYQGNSWVGNSTYDSARYLITCAFYVESSAIPEFPSAAAAVAVTGLCAAIYCWLRKKRVAAPAA
jgi:hypothetical protein